jgi:hypothetical protein
MVLSTQMSYVIIVSIYQDQYKTRNSNYIDRENGDVNKYEKTAYHNLIVNYIFMLTRVYTFMIEIMRCVFQGINLVIKYLSLRKEQILTNPKTNILLN